MTDFHRAPLSRRRVVTLGAGFVAALALLAGLAPFVQVVTELFPNALPAQPYLVWRHALLLYAAMPLVSVATVCVLAAPGIFLVLAFGRAASAGTFVLQSGVVAWACHVAAFAVVHAASMGTPNGRTFTLALGAAGAMAWIVLLLRARRGAAAQLPISDAADRALLGWMIAIPALLTVLLLPIIFWQDFNPDGLEMLTVGRSLNEWMIPRMPNGKASGLALGMETVAYPLHWFISLFGLNEAAARLPLVLYVPLLVAGVAAVAELGMPRRLTRWELACVVAAVGAFVVALAFNDTYHAYSADIASPANIDIAMVALVVAMMYALFAEERKWFVVYAVLAYFTRPTAVLVLGMIALVAVDVGAVRRLDRRLVTIAIALTACLVLGAAFERGFTTLAHVEFEQSSDSIGSRFRYLQFGDWRRLLYVLVPSGLLPALAFVAYRKFDSLGRTIALVTLGYFAFFYVLAFHVLHHFAPAMVLPVVVYWRLLLQGAPRPRLIAATALLAGAGLVISLPHNMSIDRSGREIGQKLSYQIGNYDGNYTQWRAAFIGKDAMDSLFAPYWKVGDPARERLGAPWVAIHYSQRHGVTAGTNYIVTSADQPAPAGFRLVTVADSAAVYVRDLERWKRDRYGVFDVHFRSWPYDIPRESMLAIWGVPVHRYAIDLRQVLNQVRGRR